MTWSAKCVTSSISQPPNPRLMILLFGKSVGRVSHRRIVEEPVKTIAPLGGALVASIRSKAAISFSHREKLCGRAATSIWFVSADHEARTNNTNTKARIWLEIRFICIILGESSLARKHPRAQWYSSFVAADVRRLHIPSLRQHAIRIEPPYVGCYVDHVESVPDSYGLDVFAERQRLTAASNRPRPKEDDTIETFACRSWITPLALSRHFPPLRRGHHVRRKPNQSVCRWLWGKCELLELHQCGSESGS